MADDEAIRLLEEAFHLCQNGERAPGGDESWSAWITKTEGYLRGMLNEAAREGRRDDA